MRTEWAAHKETAVIKLIFDYGAELHNDDY